MRKLLLPRNLLLSTLLLQPLPGFAQAGGPAGVPPASSATPPAGSNWQHVEAIPAGTDLHVKAMHRHLDCTLKRVDDETLVCTHRVKFDTEEVVFSRPEIKTVKLVRRARSAVIGAVAGAAAGAGAGALIARRDNYFSGFSGGFSLILSFAGGFAGAPVGYLTDFAPSTVYRAP